MTDDTIEQDDEDEAAPLKGGFDRKQWLQLPTTTWDIPIDLWRANGHAKPAAARQVRADALAALIRERDRKAEERFRELEQFRADVEARLEQVEGRADRDGIKRHRIKRDVETLGRRADDDSRASYERDVELQRQVRDMLDSTEGAAPTHVPAAWSSTVDGRSAGTSTGSGGVVVTYRG